MKENLLPVVNASIKLGLSFIAFLIPIFFLTNFVDFFELPKQILLIVTTSILTILWVCKFILEKEVRIVKTPVDFPLLGLLIVYILSTFFSISQYTSLVGFFGRYHLSLVSFVCYFLLFYIATSNLKTVKETLNVVWAFLASSALLSFLSILYYFGVYILNIDTFNIRNFTPVGNGSGLTLLIAMALPVVLSLIVYSKETLTKAALSALAVLLFVPIILINSLTAWIALAVGLIVLALFTYSSSLKENNAYLLGIALAVVVVSLLNYMPFSREVLTFLKVDYQKETQLDLGNSWAVATSSVRDYPLIGSGPSTFLYDFTRYRPAAYNLSDAWNVRYVVSNNDYLQILTTLGIVGFLSYLTFVLGFVFFAVRKALRGEKTEEHPLKVGLTASIAAFFIGTLLIPSSTATFAIFILLFGALLALEKLVGKEWVSDLRFSLKLGKAGSIEEAKDIMPYLITIPGIVLSIALIFFTYKFAAANFYYKKSLDAISQNNGSDALKYQNLSITTNPYQDVYHLAAAQTSLSIANNLATKKDLTDQEKQLISSLLDQAVREARSAATVNPLNVLNWEGLASIYRSIAGAVQGAGDWSLSSFQTAINIDPPNPQLRLDAGGLFYAAAQYDLALDYFRQAVNLKPNLPNAHYNLANAFKQLGKFNEAWVEYQTTLTLITADSDDAKKINAEMEEIKSKVTITQTQQQTPSQPATAPQATRSAQPQATSSAR